MRFMRKVKGLNSLFVFIVSNFYLTLKSKPIQNKQFDSIQIESIKKENREAAFDVYREYSSNNKVSFQNRLVWTLLGHKLCFVAVDEQRQVLGVALYYINKRDRQDSTVHAAFSGVVEHARGKGIATLLRSEAISFFKNNGFKGISSRVSLDNEKSLSVNLKLGFQIVEKYYDENLKVERVYLINSF